MTMMLDERTKWSERLQEASKGLPLDLIDYKEKVFRLVEQHMDEKEMFDLCIKTALENMDEANPNWTFFASRLYIEQLYIEASRNRHYDIDEVGNYGNFYNLLEILTKRGIYTSKLLEKYSKEEIIYFG